MTTVIDLVNENLTDNVYVAPNVHVTIGRKCSFCQCPGHNIRNCSHPDIDKLDQSAQYMYLTTCRYLRIYPNGEKTHKKWLDNLSMSEYKILAKVYRLDTNSRTRRHEFQQKLHTYCIERAEADVRNQWPTTNPRHILVIYSAELLHRIVTDEHTVRVMMSRLRDIIIQSGRNLLDMNRIRNWLNNQMELHYRIMHAMQQPMTRHHWQAVPSKNPIKMNYNVSLAKESHDECPICYTQIKSTHKPSVDCAMCRTAINECSSASNELLQKISSTLA